MRLIDADVIKCEMQRFASNLENMAESMGGQGLLCKRLNTLAEGVQRGIDMLNEQPTIERRTGKWEYSTSSCGPVAFIHRKCSECGYENMGMGSKYCPDCGAKMEGTDADT